MDTEEGYTVPARRIAPPRHLSEAARSFLIPRGSDEPYPAAGDSAAWLELIARRDEDLLPLLRKINASGQVRLERSERGGVPVYTATPTAIAEADRCVILEFHGGGLFLCGGELCGLMAIGPAARSGRRVVSVDYRMPPLHPYPAALDDGLAVYRALLRERSPGEIIVSGGSAGGNLAAALVLRARDEGLPLPAGLILATPEIDLTESGDTFDTLRGVDPGLRSLMPVNLLYANGADLAHPYLSPLFGDFSKGFPPTLLTSGTRDLFLSNTVRMHRALRAAEIPAELHIAEAGGHGNFPGTPEGELIEREIRAFIARCLRAA